MPNQDKVGRQEQYQSLSADLQELIAPRRVVTYRGDELAEIEDYVISEVPITLELNGKEFVTLLCAPIMLTELIVGFLFTETLIKEYADIVSLQVDLEKQRVTVETVNKSSLAEKLYGKRTITTGCGRGTIFYHVSDALRMTKNESQLTVEAEAIVAMMKAWQDQTSLFLLTGGTHAAALGTVTGEIIALAEDIGRHNAVDKVLGQALIAGWDLSDKLIMTTGRISSEMLIKAAKASLPVVISRSAPTELALALAQELGVTVVGFARGRRLNIYTMPQRIKAD